MWENQRLESKNYMRTWKLTTDISYHSLVSCSTCNDEI